MAATRLRLRLKFNDPKILSKTQRKTGLKRSWVFLKPQHEKISDIISYIIHSFELHESCPYGLILSMDGFVLPPFESTTILKDKDLICVKRKGLAICESMKAIEDSMPFVEDEIVEKQTLPSVVRLLANEEFDKETGGYQSETEKDEDDAEGLAKRAQDVDVASKKRKAASPIENAKRKRQRQSMTKVVQKKDASHSERIKIPQKDRKLANGSTNEVTANCTSESEPKSKSNEPKEKKEEMINASGLPEAKKISRSTRRKRLLRQMQKLNKSKVDQHDEKQLPANDVIKDLGCKKGVDSNIGQLLEDSDADDDLVAVEIRPGYVRFTSAGKAKDLQKNHETNGLDLQNNQEASGCDVQKNQEANGCVQNNHGANGWEIQSTQTKAWESHKSKKNILGINQTKVTRETFCWNGITNKRKGQNWGQENQSISWKEDYDGHSSRSRAVTYQPSSSSKQPKECNTNSPSTWASGRKQQCDASLDFEKLMPLTDLPKVGDIIAYRLLELSSSWCPELSSFRVGKVTSFDQESNKTMLVPEAEYPLDLNKRAGDDHDDDDDAEQPLQPSVYNEDGSLEIDFPSLADVRIVKRSDPNQSEGTVIPVANSNSVPSGTRKKSSSDTANQELHAPATPANEKKDVWEEISEALSAKKAQLAQDKWNKKESSAKRSWSHRTLKSSALGPTIAMLRAQNGAMN
ncbi:unnamed protein product [Amaranthus hypochondriacus]